ncbi:unnamed protein product [Acanthoscelides obtectus]|uniref:Uncharacterized protein n=1 Tax=Acanthoscelides obtectus TaxID=200917 RepID=A0A9P0LVN0_ACAOB|nr:unnamed protein product [Acanthoscelides obtectus]CAK1628410.1 hypothetical protein AOBTE_LOCUS5194 [Acanthoscelides obtectus]
MVPKEREVPSARKESIIEYLGMQYANITRIVADIGNTTKWIPDSVVEMQKTYLYAVQMTTRLHNLDS